MLIFLTAFDTFLDGADHRRSGPGMAIALTVCLADRAHVGRENQLAPLQKTIFTDRKIQDKTFNNLFVIFRYRHGNTSFHQKLYQMAEDFRRQNCVLNKNPQRGIYVRIKFSIKRHDAQEGSGKATVRLCGPQPRAWLNCCREERKSDEKLQNDDML